VILIAINVAGLIWIQHTATSHTGGRVHVLSAWPIRNVDSTDRFTLVFDEILADSSQVGHMLIHSPFVVEPHTDGHWIWSAPNRLEYRLDKPLAPGKIYHIGPVIDFEEQTGRILVGDSKFCFKTRPLRLMTCELDSSDRTHVNLSLSFNQPVLPTDLLVHTTVIGVEDSSHLDPVCLTREPSANLVLRVDRPLSEELEIVLDGSLSGADGELPLGSSVTQKLKLISSFSLERAEASRSTFEDTVRVTLDFTRVLDRNQPTPKIVLNPSVEGIQTQFYWDELRLRGAFKCGQSYSATVGANLLAEDGTRLGEDKTISFEIPDRRPGVKFPLDYGILNPHGNLTLDVEVVNIMGLELGVSRVLPNNIVAHLRGEGPHPTSRDVVNRSIPLHLHRNTLKTMALDLRELLGRPFGVYRISADASDHTWTNDSAIVTVTDLAITSKRERSGLLVWVTSLSTAMPVPAVTVNAISYNNQILASAVTDADGIARLIVPDNDPDGPPWVILAQLGEDLCFLRTDRRPEVIDGVDQSGRDTPDTYDVMLFTERGVYRPGDTIHLTGIIRDVFGSIPPSFPLAINIYRPDGKNVATLTVKAKATGQGVFQVDYPTREDGQLGRYRFNVGLPGLKDPLGEVTALVEAFVPIRMELKAEPTSVRFGPGMKPTISIETRYLFGKPAAGLPIVVTGYYRQAQHESKRLPDFSFGDPRETRRLPIPRIQKLLDENGRIELELDPPKSKYTGLWRGELQVTVTEPGSRSVSKNLTILMDTSDRYVGLRCPTGRLVRTDLPVQIEWTQLTGDDEEAKPGPVEFKVDRVEYDSTIQRVNGRYVWKSTEHLNPVLKPTTLNGSIPAVTGVMEIICPQGGLYRVTATDQISGCRTVFEFHAAAGETEAQLLAMNRPEQLEIVLDKASYKPGSIAKALIRSPLSGMLLLTLETDRVIHKEVLKLEGNSMTAEFPVPVDFRGGAFATGTVVRAIDPAMDKWLPHRAVGMARLVADHQNHELALTIDAPEQVRPGGTISVSVQTEPSIDATRPCVVLLWAVDEGILLTTQYEARDPIDYFLAHRAAVVETTDIYSDLLPDHNRPTSMERIGADEDIDRAGQIRRSPVPVRHREAAVVWQTAMPVGADGGLTVDMAMPQITGRMRILAIAIDHDSYGCAEKKVMLTAPLMVESSWPRFVGPGDEFRVPVKMFNATGFPIEVALTWDTEGPVTVESEFDSGNISVPSSEPVTVWLIAKGDAMGPVSVRMMAIVVTSSQGALAAACRATFPIRPISPLASRSSISRIKADELLTIAPPTEFLPGMSHTKICISALPKVKLLSAVESLLDYPYGCVEQTTSRLYALLHAGDILSSESPVDVRSGRVAGMIEAGITRLWSMQTRNGGIGYWPGDRHADAWGSAYAASFLLEARRAGYKIDQRFNKNLIEYLRTSLNNGGDGLDANKRALICHVLAAFNQPQQGWMARLGERLDILDMAGRAHLAAAWYLTGRRDRALGSLPSGIVNIDITKKSRSGIMSQVRQEAVLLNTLLDIAPQHVWIPILVRRLEAARVNGTWSNTLATATAIAALARYEGAVQQDSQFTGAVRMNDTEVLAFDQNAPATYSVVSLSEPIQITTSGTGDVYISVRHEGLLLDAHSTAYDQQIKVRRVWSDSESQPINPGESLLRVGDLVHVEVTISTTNLDPEEIVENVAIVDALPGGMEVENPRLAVSYRGNDSSQCTPDRVEFRDDRVIIFTSVGKIPTTYRYALRVVTAGKFAVPPIQASCMYDSLIASIHGSGHVEIDP